MIERLCIIGVGLIGGSLARALRDAGACREVVGAGRNAGNLQTAVELGVIDRYHKGQLADEVVLTDVGSAKGSVIEAAQRAFGSVPEFFVPGHPIAGTEQSGVEASFPGLYNDRRVILTPLPVTSAAATGRVRDMWEAAGAQVVSMNPVHHDAVLAATSHLPHLLAYSLVDTLARLDDNDEVFEYAAGGFRDFTRIASSDPVMWRDVCLANSDAILLMVDHYIKDLQALREAIRNHDGQQLLDVFSAAKAARDRFIDKSSE
jgi:prephenate dehydrogenase